MTSVEPLRLPTLYRDFYACPEACPPLDYYNDSRRQRQKHQEVGNWKDKTIHEVFQVQDKASLRDHHGGSL